MSRVSNGVMVITLNGNEYTLKNTVAAIEGIEQKLGGSLLDAANACTKMAFGAAAVILGAGAGLTTKESMARLKKDIAGEGVEKATTCAADFLTMILNPSDAESEGESEGEE